MLSIEETTFETIPFTFENNCTDIVLKIKQEGEKQVGSIMSNNLSLKKVHFQCWLLNPGCMINYTWDNGMKESPKCLWSVYGCEEAYVIECSPGKVLWGETKIVYKTVKKAFNSSSTSETDTDSEDETSDNDLRRQSLSSKRKASISQIATKNIVCKHKKTIYWISNCSSSEKTTVSFFTTRKAATSFLEKQKPKNSNSIFLSVPSLHLSIFDKILKENISLHCPPQSTQWYIFVHESWRYLGLEISNALEVAYANELRTFNYKGYFKVKFHICVI